MKNVNYEKPSMNFVSLRNSQAVAEKEGPCMAQSAHGKRTFYYDAPGDGWVVITTEGENCSGKASFSYYDNPAIVGSVSQEEMDKAIAAAEKALDTDKQAFTGAYLEPQPSWS
ncbi:MAG: hypothetical protein MR308_01745 [Lachnospiraceae bacterium]|nr:hypothetical protein [Lachnospiraceae bacterium]